MLLLVEFDEIDDELYFLLQIQLQIIEKYMLIELNDEMLQTNELENPDDDEVEHDDL
jgi:hypothetical protein